MYPFPTEEQINTIRTWPIDKFPQLVEYIRKLWIYDAIFTSVKTDGIEYEFVCCGWAGNEAIIVAMQENKPIWLTMWKNSNSEGCHKFFVNYQWVKEDD